MYNELGHCIDKQLKIKFFIKLITILFMLLSTFMICKMNENKLNELFQINNITELTQFADTKKSDQPNDDVINQIFIETTGKTFDEFLKNPAI